MRRDVDWQVGAFHLARVLQVQGLTPEETWQIITDDPLVLSMAEAIVRESRVLPEVNEDGCYRLVRDLVLFNLGVVVTLGALWVTELL